MLRLPPFEYSRPRSVREAATILAGEGPATRLVAGGTDLWPNLKRRHQQAARIVSLTGINELSGITEDGDDLILGATTTLAAVENDPRVRMRFPALATAVASISSPPLRQTGTIGGNVMVDTRCTYYNQGEEWRRSINYCMKAEGAVCWVAPSSPRCWAHTASDSAPMLIALGATVRLASLAGEREIPLEQLYANDGMRYSAKQHDEIVTAIRVPGASDNSRRRTAFWKLRRRGSIDFAVLSAAVSLALAEDGTIEGARVVLGAVASQPSQAIKVEAALLGRRLEPENIAAAAALSPGSATPMDNTDFQAQWRKAMVPRWVEATLRDAAGLPDAGLAPPHQRFRVQ